MFDAPCIHASTPAALGRFLKFCFSNSSSFSVAQVSEQQQFLVRASFLEIYNEEVRDLLSKNPKNKLDLKERKDQGVYVKGLNSFVVKSVAEIASVLEASACLKPASHHKALSRVANVDLQ